MFSDAKKTEAEKEEEADAQILAAIASRKKLASDRELAKGIEYTETLRTSWVATGTTCEMLSFFIGGYLHGTFAQGVRRRFRRFARIIILSSMVKTSLHRLTRSRYVHVHGTFPRRKLTVLKGHENTPTSTEVSEVKEDHDSDSHSTPGYTRSVRFRNLFFTRTASLTIIQVLR